MNRRDFLKNAGLAAGGALSMGRLSADSPFAPEITHDFKTKHLIWIVNGNGSRRMDWCQNPTLSPNFARLGKDAFVYTNSRNDTVSNHGRAWAELMTGAPHESSIPAFPTPLQYVRHAYREPAPNYWFMNGVSTYRQWRYHSRYFGDENTRPISLTATHIYGPEAIKRSPNQVVDEEFPGLTSPEKKAMEEFIEATTRDRLWEFDLKHAPIARDPFVGDALGLALIPHVMKAFKPRMLIFHQVGHDTGHGNGGYWREQTGYLEYEQVCRTTDEQVGRIFDFVRNDPYFSANTAIVVRPEFGRDDEVNRYGEISHSDGYDQTCRSAEIWYGPDFRAGVSDRLTNRLDVVPSITALFNVNAPFALGSVHREMFKP